MPGTGNASPTEPAAAVGGAAGAPGGARPIGPALLMALWLAFSLPAGAACALDLFTLWQRPELPLNLAAGHWADYRRLALADGRRTDDLLRIQCLERDEEGGWILEVVPLVETAPDVFTVVPGEGLRLHLTEAVARRRDGILQVVREVHLWRDGAAQLLDRGRWRQDPLVTASFSGDFRPDLVRESPPTVRVIGGRELECRQLEFAAADTQQAVLPQGRLIQATSQEVSAAVHQDIPLLGLAYVSERLRSESWLDPPSRRRLPPPQVRIEILECIAFGSGASALLDPARALGD